MVTAGPIWTAQPAGKNAGIEELGFGGAFPVTKIVTATVKTLLLQPSPDPQPPKPPIFWSEGWFSEVAQTHIRQNVRL